MGRLALRAAWTNPELAFAHVNDPKADAAASAHLLTFDSVHGRWPHEARAEGDALVLDGAPVSYSMSAEPGSVPWSEGGVDVVLECSGKFRTMESLAPYFEAGVRKVIVAAPVKDPAALNVVVGVNDDRYDPGTHDVLTAASCTTNCLAPVVKVIHEGIGIAVADPVVVGARAASISLIPSAVRLRRCTT